MNHNLYGKFTNKFKNPELALRRNENMIDVLIRVLIFKEMKGIDGHVKMINSVYDSLSDEEKERYRNLDK